MHIEGTPYQMAYQFCGCCTMYDGYFRDFEILWRKRYHLQKHQFLEFAQEKKGGGINWLNANLISSKVTLISVNIMLFVYILNLERENGTDVKLICIIMYFTLMCFGL